MNRYKLLDVLPETLTTQFDFTATYTPLGADAPVSYEIFDTDLFIQELEQHFTDREIRLSGDDPSASLVALFTRWKNSRSDAYARRAYALAVKYEPLENYDRNETKSGETDTTHGETVTRTHNNSDSRTYTNYHEESTRSGSATTADGTYGANSAQPVPSDTSTVTYNNVKDDKEFKGTATDSHSGTIADAHTGKDTVEDSYTLRAHGNIGVTTAAQMLEEDRKLAAYDLALVAICDFVDRYTFYLEEVVL